MEQRHQCRKHPWSFTAVLAAAMAGVCLLAFDASAQADRRAKGKADEWIGRDASELLLQLRVDGGRVEITEDDDEVRGFLERELSLHFKIRTAANGKEALRVLEEEEISLVVSVVSHSVADGYRYHAPRVPEKHEPALQDS